MNKLFGILFPLLVLLACDRMNSSGTSDDIHSASIDQLYQAFSSAYETLDTELVSGLYSENAKYLPGDPSQGILEGNDAISDSFINYFAWADSNGRALKISFNIIDRQIGDSLAFDTGYYLIQAKGRHEPEFSDTGNVGKFVTVMGLQKDGSWKFLLDGFSPAPVEEFQAAE